jgi:hypothetical protein
LKKRWLHSLKFLVGCQHKSDDEQPATQAGALCDSATCTGPQSRCPFYRDALVTVFAAAVDIVVVTVALWTDNNCIQQRARAERCAKGPSYVTLCLWLLLHSQCC